MAVLTDFQFGVLVAVVVVVVVTMTAQTPQRSQQPQQPQQRQYIPQVIQVPQRETTQYDYNYKQVGLVYTQDATEDTVYRLTGRKYPRDSNRWQYRVLTSSGPADGYSIPIELNDGEPMKELYTGDTVTIKGKESLGPFTVEIHEPEPIFYRPW